MHRYLLSQDKHFSDYRNLKGDLSQIRNSFKFWKCQGLDMLEEYRGERQGDCPEKRGNIIPAALLLRLTSGIRFGYHVLHSNCFLCVTQNNLSSFLVAQEHQKKKVPATIFTRRIKQF
ncbi:hypothetical protein NPIL_319871 [Nephila pilipes]|uniref:Uncharacterized protein n=1 Tax=Nephila pilipes TaxID=299642 RepID=A0A8X6QQW4_NEPPI|nr:hypothetical protein NPIL_319871 [Nephila pilipes]